MKKGRRAEGASQAWSSGRGGLPNRQESLRERMSSGLTLSDFLDDLTTRNVQSKMT